MILIIDGAHLMKEPGKEVENNFKYWIPKRLPSNIRLIVSVP